MPEVIIKCNSIDIFLLSGKDLSSANITFTDGLVIIWSVTIVHIIVLNFARGTPSWS